MTRKKGEIMKKTLVMGLALLTSTAFAQSYDSSNSQMNNDQGFNSGSSDYSGMESQNMDEASGAAVPGGQTVQLAEVGSRHMFEFNIDSAMRAAVGFDKTKVRGGSSDNSTNYEFDLNYFYGVHRLLQVGFRFEYFNGLGRATDLERVDLQVGAYLNSEEDFSRAAFIGGFVGGGYSQTYGNQGARDDLRSATISVGKRFPLDRWGIKHVTYTPELALKYTNSTTDRALDYSQNLQLKILQFAIIF
jgi:hypothetical protein